MTGAIEVCERGRRLAFSLGDMLAYHGHGSPGGVAHAFKVLERGLPLLDPGGLCERREIVVETAFGGPGARDAFRGATLALREGFVTPDFIDLARTEARSTEQERRLDVLKLELAERVMARPAGEVYEALSGRR